MGKIKRLKTVKWLLKINIIFWLVMALKYYLNGNSNLIISALLLIESFCYLVVYILIVKKIRLGYVIGILLTGVNTVTSLTDQVGWWDWISFSLSGVTLISLILIRKIKTLI